MTRSVERDDFFRTSREKMIERHLAARGIHSRQVLDAMSQVSREAFLPDSLQELAYEDSALPIAGGQTISQPYIVALMIEALQLRGGEKVLEVGAGSGYAAAVTSRIAANVYSLERLPELADHARQTLKAQGYDNVVIITGDGTLGYEEAAPFDAILVSAGGPDVPQSLKRQLKKGGCLVIPTGEPGHQNLWRITREGDDDFRSESLGQVRFVPLVGKEGWQDNDDNTMALAGKKDRSPEALIAGAVEPIDDMENSDLSPLMRRIGNARVVLLGEASHGTSEFYRFRARITRELIEKKGFTAVAVEADWPDAARIDHYVRHMTVPPSEWRAFTRFPTWMWRNVEVQEFVEWLRRHNAGIVHDKDRVGFYGLDLYSLFNSIEEVLKYLESVDPKTAQVARERYGCLTPWQSDPATYGRAALTESYRRCHREVVEMLTDLMERRNEYSASDGERYLDAFQNARLIASAEEYYSAIYSGYAESWNLRDSHMFDTLCSLLDYGGRDSKIVIWEHNSHIGDARATDMVVRGQHNVGQLCRQKFGDEAYLVGFGTHCGEVAAADDWGEALKIKTVRPSLENSWEGLCHSTCIPAFMLGLRHPHPHALRRLLGSERPQRAIGVIYRPETELASHYFHSRLGEQYDDYIWFDRTRAVMPLDTEQMRGMPETYPFGL